MKIRLTLLVMLFQCIAHSQTIKLNVDGQCNTSISLNNETLSKDGVYKLPLSGNGIRFELGSIPNKKNLRVAIKSINDASAIINLDTTFFKTVTSIATDENLNVFVKNKKYNLNKKFQLSIGCTDGSGRDMAVIFKPQKQTAPQVNTTGVNPVVIMAPSTNTNVTKEDAKETKYRPGSIINDALLLAHDPTEIEQEDFILIMKYYFGKKTAMGNVRDSIETNSFLKTILTEAYITSLKTDPQESVAQSDIGNFFSNLSLSSIGGLDVTAFADGAAKFIVKRAKQELSIAFFKKLNDVLTKTPDLKTVFPQTAGLLEVMGEQVYDYEKYIQNLRESFKKDISEIHRNLPGIVDNHPIFFSNHQPVKAALLSACFVAGELENGSHPGDILTTYPVEYLDSISNKNFKGSIQTLQLLSASLRNTTTDDETPYWVEIKKIRELVNDRQALKIYLGLFLQEAKNKFESIPLQGTTLVSLLNSVAPVYDNGVSIYNQYRNYVLQFGEKVDALNRMIKDEEKLSSDSLRIERYAKYFRSSVDLIEYCTQVSRLPVIKTAVPDLPSLLAKYFSIGYATADIAVDINRKNYSAAINDAVHVYNLVTVKAEYNPTASVSSAIALNSSEDDSLKKKFSSVADNFIRYGSFIATIATAKNSDEVERAIEAAALPVGSSRIKRVADRNVALNAYAGLFWGAEKINGLDKGLQANVYGVTAPIGVSISWGHKLVFVPTGKTEWSTSIFLSLLDVGAVAAFRFTDDSTSQIPTIQLKNIFSPGAFLSIGIPRTPLSVSFGAQVGPNLRKVATKNNDFSDAVYWRYSTSLLVDIPILNFHTKTK